jgi:hypothetical protein
MEAPHKANIHIVFAADVARKNEFAGLMPRILELLVVHPLFNLVPFFGAAPPPPQPPAPTPAPRRFIESINLVSDSEYASSLFLSLSLSRSIDGLAAMSHRIGTKSTTISL